MYNQRETGACAGDAAVANDVVNTQNSVHENGKRFMYHFFKLICMHKFKYTNSLFLLCYNFK